MALFGTATPVARLVTETLHPIVASTLRVLLAGVVLLPLARRQGLDLRDLTRADWLRAAALAVVGMFGFTVLLAYGMQRVPGVTGSIVMGTAPAVTALGGAVFLRERTTWRRWVGIFTAMVGVVLLRLAGGDAGFALLGVALVFGAVVAEATYTLVGKRLTVSLDPVRTTALAILLSIPLFVVASIPFLGDVEWTAVGLVGWAAVAWWGLGTLALGSIVWYTGVKDVPGHVAAAFMAFMPLSALIGSYLLLGEPPRWWHAPGAALVLVATSLVAWDHRTTG